MLHKSLILFIAKLQSYLQICEIASVETQAVKLLFTDNNQKSDTVCSTDTHMLQMATNGDLYLTVAASAHCLHLGKVHTNVQRIHVRPAESSNSICFICTDRPHAT